MDKHPIENIMSATMENLRDMIDVNTIVGEPIGTQDGSTVIPISRVSFGFLAGGGEYELENAPKPADDSREPLPFAGGTGAGVTVSPLGFLVTNQEQVRLLPAQCYQPIDRIIELIPQAMSEVCSAIRGEPDKTIAVPAATDHKTEG